MWPASVGMSASNNGQGKSCWKPGMTTLEIDVGNLEARKVEFRKSELVVTLADGRKIATPLEWYPRLKAASAKQRANLEITPMGVHWPDLDEDLSIVGMLKGQRG